MRVSCYVMGPFALVLLAACGSSTSDSNPPASGIKNSSGSHYDYGADFEPAPVALGYTRFVAPVIEDIPPGADITYCQYVMAPVDHDIDILDVTGAQSAGGHHTVAFATTKDLVGRSEECVAGDMETGFLGGTGGDGAAIQLPENTAFRLSKGSGLMLSNHFINTSDEMIQGQAVLDLKMVEVDTSRKIAGLFAVGSSRFNIPANGKANTETTCTLEKDIELFAVTNHMHAYGSSASGRATRPEGSPEVISDIPAWSPEMTGAPKWNRFLGDDSLKLPMGSTVDVQCAFQNTTTSAIGFPREMCFTIGMFFAEKAETRACLDGAWVAGGFTL